MRSVERVVVVKRSARKSWDVNTTKESIFKTGRKQFDQKAESANLCCRGRAVVAISDIAGRWWSVYTQSQRARKANCLSSDVTRDAMSDEMKIENTLTPRDLQSEVKQRARGDAERYRRSLSAKIRDLESLEFRVTA